MSKIKKLSKDDILKIAAGEVAERPANVVKELLENSLDAGATEVSLHIENAGKKLIQIIDNGSGMNQEDAILCVEQHATSKLTTIEDLTSIQTFGFRGEALASISAVSKFSLKTKEESSPTGIHISIEQSDIISTTVSCNTGTDITVSELFYNVPARRKFLKTKETEWRAIVQLFQAFNLAHLKVHFKLYHENRLIYNNPGTDSVIKRIAQIFDAQMAQNMITIDNQSDNCKISGAISNTHYYKYDRNSIFLFVNNRWVKDFKISQALIRGYQNCLPTARYPSGIIFININPDLVDVNIHPRKEEVQFLHPGLVQQSLQSCVKQALEKNSTATLKQESQSVIEPTIIKPKIEQAFNNIPKQPEPYQNNFFKNNFTSLAKKPVKEDIDLDINQDDGNFTEIINCSFDPKSQSTELKTKPEIEEAPTINIKPKPKPDILDYQLVGQLFTTYILVQTESGLMVIDQHAAHERIVFERLKKQFETIEKVQLIFAQTIRLNELDTQIILPYLELFQSFGIDIEQIGGSELIIKQTPVFLKNQSLDDIIKQAISIIKDSHNTPTEEIKKLVHQKIHAQISCKTAIKAGDKLTTESMNQLIKDLYSCENKLTCPHGRPTIWNMSQEEIEKKFKRDYR